MFLYLSSWSRAARSRQLREFDANILARINDIASLLNKDREHVFKVVDALIRDAKAKK